MVEVAALGSVEINSDPEYWRRIIYSPRSSPEDILKAAERLAQLAGIDGGYRPHRPALRLSQFVQALLKEDQKNTA